MKHFLAKQDYFLVLLLFYFVAILIVQPFGNFPLNDDWSYAKSVIKLIETGEVNIGEWPAMTLATHILWGALFVKIFGFSFLVLRLSTWVSVLIGIYAFYNLDLRITGKKRNAFLMSLTLLFNPIYFNVSQTYMTDVTFLTLLILCASCAYNFFVEGRLRSFILMLPLSIALILTRQYGIIVPAVFFVTCFFRAEKRWMYVSLSFVLLVAVYLCFHWYELYLKSVLTPWSAYKFSEESSPLHQLFWEKLWYGLSTRYKIVITHMYFHTFVFSIALLPIVLRKFKWLVILAVVVPVALVVTYLYSNYPLQVGNVFLDEAVGTDSTYETLVGTYKGKPHFYSETYSSILDVLKFVFNSISISVFILMLIAAFKESEKKLQLSTQSVFLLLLFFAYLVMILITDTFFDRYQIPVIMLSLLLFGTLYREHEVDFKWAILPFIALFYVSVFGTKDYLSLATTKWNAIEDLRNKEHIPNRKIQGGFEQVCWNEGNQKNYYDYGQVSGFDYLIQFQTEDSFTVYKEYPFKRWLSPKNDTLRVSKRILFAKPIASDSLNLNQ